MVHQDIGLLPVLLLCAVVTTAGSAAVPDSTALVTELRRLEEEFGGRLGVAARDLRTGATVAYNADERFPTASVIKLPVMAAAFDRISRGQLDPDQRITLTADDNKPGSGILQSFSDGASITLRDAIFLMITLSDNTATNLVLDRLGPDHESRMAAVNNFLAAHGLAQTRLLNRLYSWETKKQTPESIRYGIGVTTPAEMVRLLELLYDGSLVDSASRANMLETLRAQFRGDMIPRFLPAETCRSFTVANKTGGIQETKADVGLVLSDRADLALAVFVDKHDDHRDGIDNRAVLLAAHVSRAVWNAFTGDSGYATRTVRQGQVDWTQFPGGKWAIYRSPAAPFPHPDRAQGLVRSGGTAYPAFPHYRDSSIVVFVPDGFTETAEGANLIVHYHGHMNDNLGVLERYGMPLSMIRAQTNALLVLPQGPYRARDSFGGKMEDEGGFRRLVEDVLHVMQNEGVLGNPVPGRVTVSAHSGGYRPAAFTLARGGLSNRITHVFLFDAFYAQHELFREWLLAGRGVLLGAYTQHLRDEHLAFSRDVGPLAGDRLRFTPTGVDHDEVIKNFFEPWLKGLGEEWKIPGAGSRSR